MYTEKEFKVKWQKLHHPTMNVDGDVSFYYGVYKQLYDIVKRDCRKTDGSEYTVPVFCPCDAHITLTGCFRTESGVTDDQIIKVIECGVAEDILVGCP